MYRDLREYNKKYYKKNREQRKLEIRQAQKDRMIWIQSLKLKTGCQKCGYNKCATALQYHHLNSSDKKGNISRWAAQARAKKSILNEIAKCICVCSNCHAELHEQESNKYCYDVSSQPLR